MVIGDRPLEELVPLYRDPRSDMPATQFNMKYVEKAGLVKFDFLGLKTLTVHRQGARGSSAARSADFDSREISARRSADLSRCWRRATRSGCSSWKVRACATCCSKMRADRFEDIIALVALYRPGPMDNIPLFIALQARARSQLEYLHPLLEPILKETYGVIDLPGTGACRSPRILAGYTLGEADLLRRAMGKKIKSEMDAQRERFVAGADRAAASSRRRPSRSSSLVAKFAGYGFNKSHAAAYAIVAYQTAYLKANHPVEFLAASMTLDLGNTDKLQVFRREAQRHRGHDRAALDQQLAASISRCKDGGILYSLAALKNVGARRRSSIWSDGARAGRAASRRSAISRAASMRACSTSGRWKAWPRPAPSTSCIPTARRSSTASKPSSPWPAAPAAETEAGQNDLFGGERRPAEACRLPARRAWLPMERLAQ